MVMVSTSLPPLETLVARAARPGAPRIESVELVGRRYWIKRPEVLSLRWRLQKGNPARAFARERRVHRDLLELGAPVPPILAESDSYIVLADSGPSLEVLLADADPAERLRAFHAAGVALARLHGAGLAHGRPLPRDLCWDGAQITFLDFEGGTRAGAASQRRQVLDLVLATHGIYALRPERSPEAIALREGYRENDGRGVWRAAQRWARRWRWINTLTFPLQRYEARFKPDRHYKELLGIPLTFACFAD